MWCSRPPVRRVTLPILLILSPRRRSCASAPRAPGTAFGRAVQAVAGVARWGRERRPLVVADAGEGVQEGLELGEDGGLGGLGAEPVLEGLLEPLHLPLGLRVVRLPVFLPDSEAAQFGFQAVAAAPAAGEPGGEDHAVAGQRRRRGAMGGDGSAERGDHGGAGDPVVRGEGQRIAGVVIEPGQDLGAGSAGEGVVGEVGLPALVRQFRGEPDAGGLRALTRPG